MRLHGYWRSSAAYRVRIALSVKGLPYEPVYWNLADGEHLATNYGAVNGQRLVPTLEDDDRVISQSLAILEYLDEIHPSPPLLPGSALGRATVRSMALLIACDIHPLNNLRVLKFLRSQFGQSQDAVDRWVRHWIAEGFAALETLARRHSGGGQFLYGESLSLADVCFVPQLYNARRFACDLAPYPTLVGIGASLESRADVAAARPEVQSDAPATKPGGA